MVARSSPLLLNKSVPIPDLSSGLISAVSKLSNYPILVGYTKLDVSISEPFRRAVFHFFRFSAHGFNLGVFMLSIVMIHDVLFQGPLGFSVYKHGMFSIDENQTCL